MASKCAHEHMGTLCIRDVSADSSRDRTSCPIFPIAQCACSHIAFSIDDAIQVGIAQTKSPSRRISSDKKIEYDAALLHHFNTRFALQGIRAMSVVESHVHPHDGLAIRLNVHGDDSTMHLHTNGSHAMVLFDRDTGLQKRGFFDADGQYFRFSGLNGIKVSELDGEMLICRV